MAKCNVSVVFHPLHILFSIASHLCSIVFLADENDAVQKFGAENVIFPIVLGYLKLYSSS
jgi:hypothetical protein